MFRKKAELKYKVTRQSFKHEGKVVLRIVALKSFADVCTGDDGGCVSGEHNLSQKGNCWIYPGGVVMDNSRVSGNATVWGSTDKNVLGGVLKDNAKACGNALIEESGLLEKNAKAKGDSLVTGRGMMTDNTVIGGSATLQDEGVMCDKAKAFGNVVIKGTSIIKGNF